MRPGTRLQFLFHNPTPPEAAGSHRSIACTSQWETMQKPNPRRGYQRFGVSIALLPSSAMVPGLNYSTKPQLETAFLIAGIAGACEMQTASASAGS